MWKESMSIGLVIKLTSLSEQPSQYILGSLFFSDNLNDGKAAISLFKSVKKRLGLSSLRYHTMDTGYDLEPIYEQVHRMGLPSVIAYNKRN